MDTDGANLSCISLAPLCSANKLCYFNLILCFSFHVLHDFSHFVLISEQFLFCFQLSLCMYSVVLLVVLGCSESIVSCMVGQQLEVV